MANFFPKILKSFSPEFRDSVKELVKLWYDFKARFIEIEGFLKEIENIKDKTLKEVEENEYNLNIPIVYMRHPNARGWSYAKDGFVASEELKKLLKSRHYKIV